MDTLPLPPRPRVEQYRKRAKALVVAAHSSDTHAVREWARIEAALSAFADAPVDGVEVEVRDWPRRCRRHYVHPFYVYYERHPGVLYVIRLYHHARRSIER